ncbi:MAG: BREX protein BrxB domain-containing protein [Phycisphaerales bacterium]
MASSAACHGWRLLDVTDAFARWMGETDYREVYFEEPESLAMKLRSDFVQFVAARIREELTAADANDDTVVAILGVASLYGFTRVSLILKEIVKDIRGRLVVFFPGEFEDNNYRLLDARDGWNYLAVPITLHNGMHDS